jgi:hypothetical protein
MRKVEKQLIAAIEARKPFKRGNTYYDGASRVYLHGNLIASDEFDTGEPCPWMFNLAGWNTVTTRSRLNALARHFNRPGVRTLGGQAYTWRREGGDIPITNKQWF